MNTTIEKMQKKSLSRPDETRTFDKGKVELVTVNDVTFGRAKLQPGWKWSTCVKPLAHTQSCEAAHLQHVVSGRLHVVMDNGSEQDFGPGDVAYIPPGTTPGSLATNRWRWWTFPACAITRSANPAISCRSAGFQTGLWRAPVLSRFGNRRSARSRQAAGGAAGALEHNRAGGTDFGGAPG